MKRPPRRTDSPSAAATGPTLWLPPLLLFVSGAVALIFEVVWLRQFALVFGAGAPAAAAVLAAYFAGLGAGAWTVGRWARRWRYPLRAYAIVESLIGVGAVLVAPLLHLLAGALDAATNGSLAPEGPILLAGRILVAFIVLFLPTFCMGGTLPLLGDYVDHARRRLGLTVGWLYVVNTLGAALGALSVPFLLLPALGAQRTVWLGAALNLLLGAAAWWLDRRSRAHDADTPAVAPAEPPRTPAPDAATEPRLPLAPFAAASGFLTFALQVSWNRAFALVHENAVHSFAIIAAITIVALAIGAQFCRGQLRRGRSPLRLLGSAWLWGGALVLVGPWLFVGMSHGLLYHSPFEVLASAGESRGTARLFLLALPPLALPMVLLGCALPALFEEAGRRSGDRTSTLIGRLLAGNIVGAVAGALAAGFVLPALAGLWPTVSWLGLLALGFGAWAKRPPVGRWLAGLSAIAILALGWIDLPRTHLDAAAGERLVHLEEGAHGVVAVTRLDDSLRLKLNNHYVLGGTAATGDERLQAHVPLLLHPAPKSVAFLGMGTGITAGGALFHPVDSITVVELVPEVVDVARTYFAEANGGLFADPRVRVVTADARAHLRHKQGAYDVIIGDLVVPWRPGEGALFTIEHFQNARAALTPDGIVCQWVPLFQLSEPQLHLLLQTWLSVFPRAQVWRGDFSPRQPALALVSTADGSLPDPAIAKTNLAALRAPDPANPQLALAEAFWLNFVGCLDSTDLPAASSHRLNREDRPWLELLGASELEHRHAFTGAPLLDWLDRLNARNAERLPHTDPAVLRASAAGMTLARLTLAMHERDRAGFEAARARLAGEVSPALLRQLFP